MTTETLDTADQTVMVTGLRRRPLVQYLAGLGLARVVAEQADPDVTVWWHRGVLHLHTRITDLPGWLADTYVPTPVVSPWNGGSGFGAKDKKPKEVLDTILASTEPRLEPLRETIHAARGVLDQLGTGADKVTVLRGCRDALPDAATPWLDTAVVDTLDGLAFPLLLGTGGNDGRLDFSTQFHQHLLALFSPKPAASARSRLWARACVDGDTTVAVVDSPVGQYDPAAAGGANSAADGATVSLVNPWTYVLAVEGAMVFASTAVRQHGTLGANTSRSVAACPFMLYTDPVGAATLTPGEAVRGEVWAPWWDRPWHWADVVEIFSEARLQWNRRAARTATEVYKAVASGGATAGLTGFTRFVVARRNGLAYLATPADEVPLATHPWAGLLAHTDRWVARLRGREVGVSVRRALSAYDQAGVDVARAGTPAAFVRAVAAYTRLLHAVARSTSLRRDLTPPAPLSAEVLHGVAGELFGSAAVRIGFALASLRVPQPVHGVRGLRELLLALARDDHGRPVWRDAAEISGFGTRPLPAVLADVLAWWARHAVTATGVTTPGRRGALPPWRGTRRATAEDVQAWLTGELDTAEVNEALWAGLAFDTGPLPYPPPDGADGMVPVPAYTTLAPFVHGMRLRDGGRLGVRAWWAPQLAAGRCQSVLDDALRRARQAGHKPVARPTALATPPAGCATGVEFGRELAAGLLVPIRGASLSRLLGTTTRPLKSTQD